MKKSDRIKNVLNYVKSEKGIQIARMKPNVFVRNSPLNIENMVNLIIFKEGKTNQMEIHNFFNRIGKPELGVTKSALTQQRKNLNPQVFIEMNRMLAQAIYKEEKIKTIENTKLIPVGIDGSIFEIPNTKKMKEIFGHSKGTEKSEERNVARAQVSGAYDCENDIMLDATIDKYKKSEKKIAMEHIRNIKENYREEYKNMLFIFDRGYIGIPLLIYLIKEEGKFLFRLPIFAYKKEISQMKKDDDEIIIPINNDRKKDIQEKDLKELAKELKEVKVRVIKIKLESGETEILLTNVGKEEIDKEKMKEVYFKRWNIEKSYDVIKNKLEVENFSGYSEIAIKQDFYAQILLFNIIEDIKNTANREIQEEREKSMKTYKYEYIVNLNILIGICKQYLILLSVLGNDERSDEIQDKMLRIIKRNLIAIKSGRKNKRKWNINNKYRTNMRRN